MLNHLLPDFPVEILEIIVVYSIHYPFLSEVKNFPLARYSYDENVLYRDFYRDQNCVVSVIWHPGKLLISNYDLYEREKADPVLLKFADDLLLKLALEDFEK